MYPELSEIPQPILPINNLSDFRPGGVRLNDNRTISATPLNNKLVPLMKTTKLILASALFASLAAFSFAGMGAQYWTQQSKNSEAQKAQATASTATSKAAMNCATCICCSSAK